MKKQSDDEVDLTGNLDFDDWKTVLALSKALQDRAKLLEAQAKAHLIDDLLPNEPVSAYMGGKPLASISVTKGGVSEKLGVTSAIGFATWLEENGHKDDVEYVAKLKDYTTDPSFIEKLAEENGGELPEGTDVITSTSRQTVRVSLDRSAKDKPLDFSVIPELMPLLGIEAAKTVEEESSETEEDPWNRV
jgi:hypothetical protein